MGTSYIRTPLSTTEYSIQKSDADQAYQTTAFLSTFAIELGGMHTSIQSLNRSFVPKDAIPINAVYHFG